MSVPVSWVVTLMVALEPSAPWRDTYEKTAAAIARASEADPLFDADGGEARTAALLVAIAWTESHLKPNAKSRNGRWYCLYQIDKGHLADPKKTLDDPDLCTRTAMKLLHGSFERCKKHPLDDRLAGFVSSSCDKGLRESRYRMHLAKKLVKDHPVPAEPAGGRDAGAVTASVSAR